MLLGVGIDAVSTTVKRSFNGGARRRSQPKDLEGHPASCHLALAGLPPLLKTEERVEQARLLRFAFRKDGRAHTERVRARPSSLKRQDGGGKGATARA